MRRALQKFCNGYGWLSECRNRSLSAIHSQEKDSNCGCECVPAVVLRLLMKYPLNSLLIAHCFVLKIALIFSPNSLKLILSFELSSHVLSSSSLISVGMSSLISGRNPLSCFSKTWDTFLSYGQMECPCSSS